MNGQPARGWQRKVAWVVQVLGVLVAVGNIRVPPNNEPVAELVLRFVVPNANGDGAAGRVQTALERMRAWDRDILCGDGPFDPRAAVGFTVFALFAFGILWVSRWFDGKDGPRVVERLLNAAVPPSLVGLALVSPSTALVMAATQAAFELCYPPPRDIYIIAADAAGNVRVGKM
jgi:hypothetical protein